MKSTHWLRCVRGTILYGLLASCRAAADLNLSIATGTLLHLGAREISHQGQTLEAGWRFPAAPAPLDRHTDKSQKESQESADVHIRSITIKSSAVVVGRSSPGRLESRLLNSDPGLFTSGSPPPFFVRHAIHRQASNATRRQPWTIDWQLTVSLMVTTAISLDLHSTPSPCPAPSVADLTTPEDGDSQMTILIPLAAISHFAPRIEFPSWSAQHGTVGLVPTTVHRAVSSRRLHISHPTPHIRPMSSCMSQATATSRASPAGVDS